jgi:hypothetical protein
MSGSINNKKLFDLNSKDTFNISDKVSTYESGQETEKGEEVVQE